MSGIIGYLVKSSGCEGNIKLYVYPTRESYELGFPRDSLRVTLNPHFKGLEKFENGMTIEVIGIFKRAQQGTVEGEFGSLADASMRVVRPVTH